MISFICRFLRCNFLDAVVFKDRNRVMSFYFLVTFNLNKGASTSIAASSKTRWEKNLRATLNCCKALKWHGVCMGRKMDLVLKYLESSIPCCCEGILGDFLVPFVFEMGDEWVYLKCVLWGPLSNWWWFVAIKTVHKVTGSFRFLWADTACERVDKGSSRSTCSECHLVPAGCHEGVCLSC